MNMFIVWKVLAAAAGGATGAVAVWAGMGWIVLIRPLESIGGWPFGFIGALLGLVFAGPPSLRGCLKGAAASGALGVPLVLFLGPIGILWGILPLGVAGGIAAAIFPRDDHGTA